MPAKLFWDDSRRTDITVTDVESDTALARVVAGYHVLRRALRLTATRRSLRARPSMPSPAAVRTVARARATGEALAARGLGE